MADRYTVEYDLSEIDSWEELYTYDGDQILDDDGNEISNLSQDTQQIIVHSAMFAVPVLDEIGIKEWLIRQYLLCNVGCYDCPLSIDSLYRHRNLKTNWRILSLRTKDVLKLIDLSLPQHHGIFNFIFFCIIRNDNCNFLR